MTHGIFHHTSLKWATAMLAATFFLSCNTDKARNGGCLEPDRDSIMFKYARNISAIQLQDCKVVTLRDPWHHGKTLSQYVLVARDDSASFVSRHDRPQGIVVYTPLRRVITFASPHNFLLEALGMENAIVGACDIEYNKVEKIRRMAKEKKIADCGNAMQPSMETIIETMPDALLMCSYENRGQMHIEKLGIPVIECAEYMETSALGRAEWMRFYGMIMGCEDRADSLFHVVESHYADVTQKTKTRHGRKRVLTERVYNGTWYCPGGNSSMGRLIADAGADYVFANRSESGSLPLSPETVMNAAADADVWLFVYDGEKPMTRDQLLKEMPGYALIKAFRDGNFYQCSAAHSTYFDELSFRPDLLIRNIAEILYPDLFDNAEYRYYRKYKQSAQ